MTPPDTAIVFASTADRALANALVSGLIARSCLNTRSADLRSFARRSMLERAVVVVPCGGVDWRDTELPVLVGAIMVGDLTGATSMLRALAAGARSVVNSHMPFTSLLDQVQAELNDVCTEGATYAEALVARLVSRVAEAQRIAALTDREFEVLGSIYAGGSVAGVAQSAHISAATVRAHVRSILHKLQVHSQIEACAMLRRSGHDRRSTSVGQRISRF
jgi:two-component system, NarL family, nitrate/nitrite response regulator NarL